jgi:hypothetical protein
MPVTLVVYTESTMKLLLLQTNVGLDFDEVSAPQILVD